MPEYVTHIDIGAPPQVVFDHLTTVAVLLAWMGEWAELTPEPGGTFAVNIQGTPVRGRYLEVDPPRRVVVSWGMAGAADFPEGSSQVTAQRPARDTRPDPRPRLGALPRTPPCRRRRA